jgi:hypothetical protein
MQLNELDKASDDITKAISLNPSDSQLKAEMSKLKKLKEDSQHKEKKFYGGIFNKLSEHTTEDGLYADKKPEPSTRLCTICNQQVEKIQWARHVIKMHGAK